MATREQGPTDLQSDFQRLNVTLSGPEEDRARSEVGDAEHDSGPTL